MDLLKQYFKKYWYMGVAVLILAAINQIFTLIDPIIFRHIIDDYVFKIGDFTRAQFIHGIGILMLLSVGAAFMSRVAKNFQDYFLNMITARIGAQLYSRGVEHSLSLPFSVLEDTRSGETLGILQKARLDTEKFIAAFVNIFFISFVGFIFVSIYAAFIYWGIAVIYLATVPIIGGLSYFLSSRVKLIQKQIVAETTALAGSTTESLRNIELVKSLGLVSQEIGRLNNTTDKILDLELKKLRYVRSISFIQGTCINLLRTLILMFMLYLIYTKVLTFGQFYTLFIYSFFVFGPLQEIGTVLNNYREASASLDKMKTVLDAPSEPVPDSTRPSEPISAIRFDNVSFSYNGSESQALENITFEARAGETIAFVGPSGSGKTSVVKLMVGLYRPNSGDVRINTHSLFDYTLDDIRKNIGFVTQETQLFAGTLRENLLFVNPTATDEQCTTALEMAACHSLITRLDKGLDSVIGEGGVKVSGGERQRISIARALLRNPSLLICDEATSALDSITEHEITKTIQDISKKHQPITVLIAHRLSTIMHADRIYVLEKGSLVESGSHAELLEHSTGLYAAMWRQQSGERV
jgi:ATP-binding cassette subfamily B protein